MVERTSGKRMDGLVRSPNLLASAYIARRASLPILLNAFHRTQVWRRGYLVDQVLACILCTRSHRGACVYAAHVVDALCGYSAAALRVARSPSPSARAEGCTS